MTNVSTLDKSQNHPQMKSVFFQKEQEMLQSLCRGDICLDQEKEKGVRNFNIQSHSQIQILIFTSVILM